MLASLSKNRRRNEAEFFPAAVALQMLRLHSMRCIRCGRKEHPAHTRPCGTPMTHVMLWTIQPKREANAKIRRTSVLSSRLPSRASLFAVTTPDNRRLSASR